MQINPFVFPLSTEIKTEIKNEKQKDSSSFSSSSSFGEMVMSALQKVNEQQLQSQEATSRFLSGDLEDIHQLMIASEQAKISLQLTLQVTNKIIEAYRELSRIQV